VWDDGTFGKKFSFIEDHAAGEVNHLRVGLQAAIASLIRTIAEEYAGFAAKG
jgi:hypothetical protein